jgi:hypothetical protein
LPLSVRTGHLRIGSEYFGSCNKALNAEDTAALIFDATVHCAGILKIRQSLAGYICTCHDIFSEKRGPLYPPHKRPRG